MRQRTETVLKAFLGRFSKDKQTTLERFLPQSVKERLDRIPEFQASFDTLDFSLLEKVHWSWFLPTLKTYMEGEQKLFLASLSPYAAKNLIKALVLSTTLPEITEIARSYFRKLLLDSLIGPHQNLLPIPFIPPSPLNPLAEKSKKDLTKIIDFLSLYDLAGEIRQIVETKILKKIYSFLSGEEKAFLKTATTHKELFHLERMGLDRWDGTEKTFRTILHKRGIHRLGAALCGQNPDLIWYVCHKLDIGRGNALYKCCAQEPISGVTEIIQRQLEDLLSL